MSKEILAIPEEHLQEVIDVIRYGLRSIVVSNEVYTNLIEFCDTNEEYLQKAKGEV